MAVESSGRPAVAAAPGELAATEVRLDLVVDTGAGTWTGRVEFPGTYVAEGRRLDADGLTIHAIRQAGRSLSFGAARSGIELAEPVARDGTVEVDFSGHLETKSLFGLYRSPHGPGPILTTHCEPTGARKVFPCVDRPDRKIRLALTVRTRADLEVVANSPPRSSEAADGVRTWVFEPTPPMSTYLFYLGIAQFDRVDATGGRVAVSVLCPPGRADGGRWAAEVGPKVLAACEAYYGIPYPLRKLDLLAISEHAFGAMENWGAITFQESRLLFEASSTAYNRRDIVETIAHEIAHQWFGNLVTMGWWDDIWLNESFAALMETKITEKVAPELDPWTDFFLRVAGFALALDGDSLRCTHPIRAGVADPDEISQIFDEISYGKGSGVLAMLDGFLGAATFRAGVKEYLERFRFANARTDDLWAALERASGEKVAAIAAPWTDRPGLPVVTAHLGPDGLTLRQQRFAYLGSTDEPPWPIPMVVDVDGTPQRIRFDTTELRVPVPDGATVHLNPGGLGFYRVRYDRPMLERLVRALPARSPADRWSVLSDLDALLLAGEVDWSTYREVARTLRATDDRLVVETLVGSIGGLALTFPDHVGLRHDALDFLRHWTERFGIDPRPGEAPSSEILRDRVAFTRVRLDAEFAAELAPRFDRWDAIDPGLRSAVAIGRVVAGGAAGFETVLRGYRGGGRPAQDALRFAWGLAWSPDPTLVERVLEMAVAGEINRSHITRVAGQAATNPHGREVTYRWLVRRLPELSELFRGSGYLPLLLDALVPLVGLGRENELRGFFAAHPVPDGDRGLAKGLERLEILGRLRARLAA